MGLYVWEYQLISRMWCLFWTLLKLWFGGTAAAVPLPFRPGNPALCGSHPLVTPYYCRLGDLLCFVFMYDYCAFLLFVYCLCVPSVLWYCWLGLLTCKNRLPYNLYCVGGDVKPCTITIKLWCARLVGVVAVLWFMWRRICLAHYHICYCPSVTWVDQSEMVEVRIMPFSLYSSPVPLVFAG